MTFLAHRRTPASFSRRRGTKKFSEATLLRMLFVMLGVIFVVYAVLMVVITRYTHSAGVSKENLESQIQQRRDLRPPLSTRQQIDVDGQPRHDAQTEKPPLEWKDKTLKAYIEPVNQQSWTVKPLPIRTTTSSQLKVVEYSRLTSCSKLPEQWPIDEYPEDDPFLPWIHDVFPTHDGKFIQFVAQNRRRCDTGRHNQDEAKLDHRRPQNALFQHVAVKRIDNGRYRLSTHEEAEEDGKETRFICRFKPSMDETLSVFNLNYDYVALRKGHKHTFSESGRWDIKSLHTSQLVFKCPVPEHLQQRVRDGSSVIDDFASIFVDLIPIRTPPRYTPPNAFLPPRYAKLVSTNSSFQPEQEWGNEHVLPTIENSGRWENIPICKPSLMTYQPSVKEEQKKPHKLVSCLWASAGYATRGDRFAISDGQRRLREWLHYVFLVGFDHVYVYDNSAANSNTTSLQGVTDEFPERVTRIIWPSKVCNNNRNFADSPGERSSQYAAESSCRLRFGDHTDWIGQFDIDEYLSPQGDYTSLIPLLDKLDTEGKKIVSFGSWRAWPRKNLIEPPEEINNVTVCNSHQPCFHVEVPRTRTILQTFNCDRQRGQKKAQMPAEKQLYRPDYVKLHFVHYSCVTLLTLMNEEETRLFGQPWRSRIAADPLSRFGNEVTEATMLHSKAIAIQDTAGWLTSCKVGSKDMCRIGNPYPEGAELAGITADSMNWTYNCYVNEKIENHFVPLLEKSMNLSNRAF